MPLFEEQAELIGRKVLNVFARIEHGRSHRHTLRRGQVSKIQRRKAKETWWGKEPRWYPGGTPPRLHNQVTPLIDGESFFTALREALEEAQYYVYIVGWCMTPRIPLGRESRQQLVDTQLLEMLSRVATRLPVRILLWSGAALLKPTSREVRAVKAAFERDGRGDIVCELDHSAHPTHCHHQKAVVVDGQVAFVGGMDLTTFSGDRFDTPQHALRVGQNWHDVQLRIRGEVVADVERNFLQRWQATTGDKALPSRQPYFESQWETPVQIARTVPAGVYPFAPRGEFAIHHWYTEALRRARKLIYLENQYLWSPFVMEALLGAIAAPHDDPFRIVIVLPAFAGDGRWDNDKHVARLREADGGRGIVSVYSLYTSGLNTGEHPFSYRAIYVHAKVAIIDDEWLAVGSANLNNRGLVTDGEMNAVVNSPSLARRTRVALWAEHLGIPEQTIDEADPADVIDRTWKASAEENQRIITRGSGPLVNSVHSYTVGHKPGYRVLEDVQSISFEH